MDVGTWCYASVCNTVVCRDCIFFFSSRRRHTRFDCDWSSDVCSSDLVLDKNKERMELALTMNDVRRIAASNKMAVILGLEAGWDLDGDLQVLRFLHRMEIGRASCRERV